MASFDKLETYNVHIDVMYGMLLVFFIFCTHIVLLLMKKVAVTLEIRPIHSVLRACR